MTRAAFNRDNVLTPEERATSARKYGSGVCPAFFADDHVDRRVCHAKLASEFRAVSFFRRVLAANKPNVFDRKFCRAHPLAFCRSTFCHHISRVLLGGSAPQMLRIHTCSVIAGMADVLVSPFAGRQKVSHLMSPAGCPFPVLGLNRKSSVAFPVFTPVPLPAITIGAEARCFINLCPEADGERQHGALSGTKTTCSISATLKLATATLTSSWYFVRSHDLNLQYRLGLWLGSFAVQPAFGPFVF